MSKNIWEEFDEKIDTEGLAKDAKDAAENGGDYKEVHLELTKLKLIKWS